MLYNGGEAKHVDFLYRGATHTFKAHFGEH